MHPIGSIMSRHIPESQKTEPKDCSLKESTDEYRHPNPRRQPRERAHQTLDPDIDTYYLMDAALFRLPVMIETAAQVRGLGGAMLAMGSATTLQKRRLIEQLAILQANALAMDAGLAKTVAYNGSVRERVKTQAYQPTLKGFTDKVEASLLAQEGVQGEAATLVAASDQAIAAMLELAGQSSRELDMLVGVRVSAMAQSRQITTVVLLLGLLSAAYLFISFRKVLDGGLREVSSHIQGNFSSSGWVR
jgi:hypothetical protein